MIHTRGIGRRKIYSSTRRPNNAESSCKTMPNNTISIQSLAERVHKLEQLLLCQISTTPPNIQDTSRSLHRIMLTDTISTRMELPALHHIVVASEIRGTRKVPVRPMHTAQIGDRLTDGRVQTTIVDITPQCIITAAPVTFGASQALATVPAKYAVPGLYYVYNLSGKNIHVVSGATAITIRPAHEVKLSLTHAGFRLIH